jgi:hypothetical protein
MWRSVAIGVVFAGMLAGCSLGGSGSAGEAPPTSEAAAHQVTPAVLLSRVPFSFTGGPLHRVVCRVRPGRAACTALVKGRPITIFLERVPHGPKLPECSLGHGTSVFPPVYCRFGGGVLVPE